MADDAADYPSRDVDPILAELEEDWAVWLATLFPEYFSARMADHQIAFWDHIWSIRPGLRVPPWISIWNRGGAKSTSSEAAAVSIGARNIRRYGLYICSVQSQSDDHVANIASMLESETFGEFYPDHADRALGKYGAVKGWRRNRLRTSGGLTIDALGLDVAARGLKLEDQRPDFIILDDLDEEQDTVLTTERKVRSLTRKILPAGTSDTVVIAIQNLVSNEGIFGQLAGRSEIPADYLVDRIVSGPIPAIIDMQVVHEAGRWKITGGTATWEGMDLEACQDQIDTYGLTSFRIECLHEVEAPPGGMYDHVVFERCTAEEVPALDTVEVWVDPAVTDTDQSDAHAIQVDGISRDHKLYRLFSWERRASPTESIGLAFRKALDYGATAIGIETDQGGDTWESVFREARQTMIDELLDSDEPDYEGVEILQTIRMKTEKASKFKPKKTGPGHGQSAKANRSSRMLTDYERGGRIIHVMGTHDVLEAALRRFPRYKPRDLADAAFYGWYSLKGKKSPARTMTAAGRSLNGPRRLTAVR